MDSKQYGPWAFIAGGSEGVGTSFARKLGAAGINLVLSARKPEPLEETAELVRTESKVTVRTLPLDLTAPDMLDRVKAITSDVEVGMLIYNAGAENRYDDVVDRELANCERVVSLNVTGPLRLAHHFGGGMKKRRRGGIILVGSNAAYAGMPKLTLYSATKSWQAVFAEGLWYELRPHNVHVLALMLGVTRTPAMERLGLKFDTPGMEAAEPDDVAQEGFDHLANGPVWHAAGTGDFAHRLKMLPRAQAVAEAAAGSDSVAPS
jgi:short-subunit dehydrogenase